MLTFTRKSKYHSMSEQGYIVSFARVNGNAIFTAWTPATTTQRAQTLACGHTAQQCYSACNAHFQSQQKKASHEK